MEFSRDAVDVAYDHMCAGGILQVQVDGREWRASYLSGGLFVLTKLATPDLEGQVGAFPPHRILLEMERKAPVNQWSVKS